MKKPDKWGERWVRMPSTQLACEYRSAAMQGESTAMTYRELLERLQALTPEQLEQRVELLPPHSEGNKAARLEPVIGLGTVEEMCHVDGEVFTDTRSSRDFTHHPEQVVLLRDGSPFSKDGDSYYTMTGDGAMVGNKTGKVIKFGDKD